MINILTGGTNMARVRVHTVKGAARRQAARTAYAKKKK